MTAGNTSGGPPGRNRRHDEEDHADQLTRLTAAVAARYVPSIDTSGVTAPSIAQAGASGLSVAQLEFIVRVLHRELVRLLEQAEAGRCECEARDALFDQAVRDVRATSNRPTYAERRARELERSRPTPGDYTGRLSSSEYFGRAA